MHCAGLVVAMVTPKVNPVMLVVVGALVMLANLQQESSQRARLVLLGCAVEYGGMLDTYVYWW